MRLGDFTNKVKKSALERSKFKCERCWSIYDLEFHHKLPLSMGGNSTLENCVVLCHNCHSFAPKDPILFEKYFIKFALVFSHYADDIVPFPN